MLLFVRELMRGMLAWMCGNWAVSSVPVSPLLSLAHWSDIVTLFLFRPAGFLVSAVAFVSACWLLYKLLVTHGKRLFQPTALHGADRFLHALVWLFSLYVAYIQLVKIPIPTLVAICLMAAIKFSSFIRRRNLREEFDQPVGKK
ncbi:hypothetical protein [Brevibacillus sp. H7]|uniref:hypothetical protein n=1 Tax=Brevibacillus sp. H7 TaxID=3349138 RepID=UPI0038282C85